MGTRDDNDNNQTLSALRRVTVSILILSAKYSNNSRLQTDSLLPMQLYSDTDAHSFKVNDDVKDENIR